MPPKSNPIAAVEPYSSSFCSTAEAARMLGVGKSTIQRFVDDGILSAWKTQGGHRRILLSSVEAMIGRHHPPSANLAVLVTDAEPESRSALIRALEAAGLPLTVHVSEDGIDALLKLPRLRPDLWILDAKAGGIDSMAAIKRISSMREMNALGIIFGMAKSLPKDELDALRQQGVIALRKPWPAEQIKGMLVDAHARLSRQHRHGATT